MSGSKTSKLRLHLAAGVAALALLPAMAYAQTGVGGAAAGSGRDVDAQTAQVEAQASGGVSNTSSEKPEGEIVVTGTLLRGTAPIGSNVISVGAERLQSQGATTSNELLATVPQVSNLFNNVPNSQLSIAQNAIQVVRPNLRSLTPATSSSSATLVLFDGHRIAGAGVSQSVVDPDLIPAGAIERVEVVTDGGSATYGADAVGGVINFITRKRFNGLAVDARYGFADDYYQTAANVTAGKDWGSGSLFASYSFQKNDALFGRDRDYIRQIDYNTGTAIGRQCNPGNVTLPGAFSFQTFTFGPSVTYALPGLNAPGTFNACDSSDDATFVPRAQRHSGLVGLHQELSSAVTVDLRAFYARRTSRTYTPPRGDVNVTPTNAFYRPLASNPTATQVVSFTFAPVLGSDSTPSGSAFEEWGANAEFTADIGSGFQVRQLFNYSRSDSRFFISSLNQTLLNAAGSAANPQAAINFYNPGATPNLALIRAIVDSEGAGQAKNELINARSIIEGPLFTLPGGEVRLAAGYEFIGDRFAQRTAVDAVRGTIASQPYTSYNRNDNAAFGEISVPIFGAENRTTLLYALTFAASVRYDHYSDFGSTTNPKFGVTYKPLEWLALRGNYSTSFNAPSPVDQLGSARNTIGYFPFNPFVRQGDNPQVTGALALQGATPNLRPQKAETYSFGGDLDLPFLSGFHASGNYYNVKFENLLTTPTPDPGIFVNFPDNVQTNVNGLTAAQLRAFALLAPNGSAVVEPIIAGNRGIYEVIDFRVGNFGVLRVDGLDFAANYRVNTGFGGLDATVNGNYTLNRTFQSGPGAIETNVLDPGNNYSRLQLQATLGGDIGTFRAQATLNHSSGFEVIRAANLPQDRVKNFDTINLFFRYDVPSNSRLLKDLSFTANINNVFDQAPSVYRFTGDNGFTTNSGFTLGRLFMFGVAKKF